MYTNLVSLFGNFIKTKFTPETAYGHFKLLKEVSVGVKGGNSVASRDYSAAESYTAWGDIRVEMGPPLHDPRGMNVDTLTEAGQISPSMISAAVTKWGGLGSKYRASLDTFAYEYVRDDSHVSLLVSMLSSAYVLQAKELKIRPNIPTYDDGHVKLEFYNNMDPYEKYDDWRCDDMPSAELIIIEEMQEAPDRPTLYLPGISEEDMEIILCHLGGRHKTTDLSFDLEIPCLADAVSIHGRIRAPNRKPPVDVSSKRVIRALNNYVIKNRLYGQMEVALTIMAQCMLTPVPDTAEGAAWFKRRRTVILPEFESMRGSLTVLTMGKSYGVTSQVTETWNWWQESQFGLGVAACQMNTLSLWGRYLVEGSYYSKSQKLDILGPYRLNESPGAAYAAYLSLFSSEGIYFPVPLNYGLHYDDWREAQDFWIDIKSVTNATDGYVLKKVGDKNKIYVEQIPPPCSPLSVLGRMPMEGNFKSLSNFYEIDFEMLDDGWQVKNADQAWGLAMATRWLGHDMWIEHKGVEIRGNWASNMSQVAFRPINVTGRDKTPVRITRLSARKNVFRPLPAMCDESFRWEVSVSASQFNVLMPLDRNVRMHARGAYVMDDGRHDTMLKDAEKSVPFAPIIVKAFERTSLSKAGFQIAESLIGPYPPPRLEPGQVIETADRAAEHEEIVLEQ